MRKTADRFDGLFTPDGAIVKSAGALALQFGLVATDELPKLPQVARPRNPHRYK